MHRVECPFADALRSLEWEEELLSNGKPCYSVRTNEPCVSVGFNQDAAAEVNLALARKLSIPLVRRKTGGGAVYRDQGCLAFSFVVPTECKDLVVGVVRSTLAALGIKTAESESNDLLWNGLKVSGMAWRSNENMLLVHGSLLFDTDIELMSRLLDCGKKKYHGTAIASVSARVVNLSAALPNVSMTKFVKLFISELDQQVAIHVEGHV
jgi:lipoate---protein ligase